MRDTKLTYVERYGHLAGINKTFSGVKPEEYDAVYCAGGREYIRTDERTQSIVKHFHDAKKPIFTICHRVQILVAVDGVVRGKKVAALGACEPEVKLAGGTYIDVKPTDAYVDGTMVSAKGWTGLAAFMRECLEVLGTEIRHGATAAGRRPPPFCPAADKTLAHEWGGVFMRATMKGLLAGITMTPASGTAAYSSQIQSFGSGNKQRRGQPLATGSGRKSVSCPNGKQALTAESSANNTRLSVALVVQGQRHSSRFGQHRAPSICRARATHIVKFRSISRRHEVANGREALCGYRRLN